MRPEAMTKGTLNETPTSGVIDVTPLGKQNLITLIWGWVKTLVPCREPQVIAGLKWMFIPLKYGIYRY